MAHQVACPYAFCHVVLAKGLPLRPVQTLGQAPSGQVYSSQIQQANLGATTLQLLLHPGEHRLHHPCTCLLQLLEAHLAYTALQALAIALPAGPAACLCTPLSPCMISLYHLDSGRIRMLQTKYVMLSAVW